MGKRDKEKEQEDPGTRVCPKCGKDHDPASDKPISAEDQSSHHEV